MRQKTCLNKETHVSYHLSCPSSSNPGRWVICSRETSPPFLRIHILRIKTFQLLLECLMWPKFNSILPAGTAQCCWGTWRAYIFFPHLNTFFYIVLLVFFFLPQEKRKSYKDTHGGEHSGFLGLLKNKQKQAARVGYVYERPKQLVLLLCLKQTTTVT